MAPPSNLDRAVADRNTLLNTIFYLEDELVEHATTPVLQAQVDNFLTTVNQCQVDVLEIHNRIQHSFPADINDHNTVYYETRKRISKLLAKFTTIKLAFPATIAAPGSNANAAISSEIKLPPLQLPTFDGNLHEWISFRDIFNTIVIQNNKFGKSQKLTYLKLQLRGEAARQVQSLLITDANFDVAWSQLINRYQSDRELFLAVYNKLFDQPQVISKSSDSIRQLIDVTQECKRSLEGLNIPTDPLDSMFVAVLIRKMDSSSRELWERTLPDNSIPKVKALIDFLEQQARALSSSRNSAAGNKQSQPQGPSRHTRANPQQVSYHVQSSPKCKICHETHIQSYFKCRRFMTMSVPERIEAVKKIQSCYNCLSDGHQALQCSSTRLCKQCNRKHHTLLHRQVDTSGGIKPQEALPLVHFSTPVTSVDFDTILATAIVEVTDRHGHPYQCRAFVDSGSNTHYITEDLIKKLGLPRKRYCVASKGLGGASVGVSSYMTQFSVSSLIDKAISFPISRCLVTKTITCQLPVNPFNHQKWSHLHNIPLADPEYHTPKDVDMLLGSEFFFAIFGCEKRSGPPNSPVAIKTGFGWLIGGGSPQPTNHPTNQLVHATQLQSLHSTSMGCDHEDTLYDIDLTLRKQWEMDSEPSDRLRTLEENAAEAHFLATYRRDPNGRFLVELPFKAVAPAIGSSLSLAVKRLQYLERRLTKLPDYRQEYEKFMQEYENLGHMQEVPPVPLDSNHVCYIPHHFVLKESSSTTKFRVVFDASAKTSTGVSLNDTMMVGPTIQDSLFEILCRFRLHKYAFTADIAKMYRQVLISPSNNPQRIVWRNNPTLPIKHFQLLTVTYGTGPGPFLATRALQELANLESLSYPRASQVLKRDAYVDDVLSGEPTEEEALATQQQLLQLAKKGAFDLRKWSSNSRAVMDALPPEYREMKSVPLFEEDSTIKTLGISWNPNSDKFLFNIAPISPNSKPLTKRIILSQLASLFDPIGWLAPILITGKILMQSIWKLKQDWDDEVPEDVKNLWKSFQEDIQGLNKCSFPRFVLAGTDLTCPSLNSRSIHNPVKFSMAGFCDASVKAFAAVVYLCAYDGCGSNSVTLMASKTRVSPIKEVSIPRLELCSALILSDLLPAVKKSLRIPIQSTAAWTDSTVSLAWIQSSPSRWKTFVANRVTKIQERIPPDEWRHVPGTDNPADCASRGIDIQTFISHELWWKGPNWLSSWPHYSDTPHPEISETDIDYIQGEEKQVINCHSISTPDQFLLHKYSSFPKLCRVTAYIFRFIRNVRNLRPLSEPTNQPTNEPTNQPTNPPLKPSNSSCRSSIPIQIILTHHPLSMDEINQGSYHWIKLIQGSLFADELKCLHKKIPVHRESKLRHLSPFIDQDGLIRVGGRLRNSPLPADRRHPILLPYHCRITELIIRDTHLKQFHAGPQLVLSTIMARYWILRGKDAVRYQIRKCVICTRQRAQTLQEVMGDLPSFRVTQARAFSKVGVDYAGPFHIRPIQSRSKVTLKAYIAVFVCPVTRAIHLEVVSDLSTSAFLAALRRFVSRRGRPTDIYSDCGTNFVGADNELKDMYKMLLSSPHNLLISKEMSNMGITWHFNPPAAPHFGGLWEAGVKSMKHHLRRIMGLQRLTFEELYTTIAQIEAILNSRPLTPESTSPDDLAALTPGHFLIGCPLNSFPELNVEDLPINRLSRWQLLQQFIQTFWRRWSAEYLTRLQQRPKWMTGERKISVGDLVLIKEENLPPLQWRLGRVKQLHPGRDSIPRVATLKVQSGELKRPIVKLCLLPVDHSTSSTSDSATE